MDVIAWDESKNEKNFKKHGVWFEEAQTVITNPLSLININDHPDGDRMEYLGYSLESRILYVVTVENNESSIRIISAREASSNERIKYEEGI